MSYRTLEEKFLADYEALESENRALRDKVEELSGKLSGKGGSYVLDAAVRAAGRRKVLDDTLVRWTTYSAINNSFESWVSLMVDNRLLNGVSFNEFIEYFNDELTERYEEKYAREQAQELSD